MELLTNVENNTYLKAMAAVFVISGSRFINLEFNRPCKNFLAHPFIRKMIIFSYIYIITGKLGLSIVTTITFYILTRTCFGGKEIDIDDNNINEKEL